MLHELYANLRRVAPSLPVKEARALVSSYRRWQPLAVDEATVDLAWTIQDDTAYSYWDCLMLAAAQEQGCAYLLTEDLQHGQRVDSLTILNPFLSTPDELPATP